MKVPFPMKPLLWKSFSHGITAIKILYLMKHLQLKPLFLLHNCYQSPFFQDTTAIKVPFPWYNCYQSILPWHNCYGSPIFHDTTAMEVPFSMTQLLSKSLFPWHNCYQSPFFHDTTAISPFFMIQCYQGPFLIAQKLSKSLIPLHNYNQCLFPWHNSYQHPLSHDTILQSKSVFLW